MTFDFSILTFDLSILISNHRSLFFNLHSLRYWYKNTTGRVFLQEIKYGNWASGEPSGGGEDLCIHLLHTREWNDFSCAKNTDKRFPLYALCEIRCTLKGSVLTDLNDALKGEEPGKPGEVTVRSAPDETPGGGGAKAADPVPAPKDEAGKDEAGKDGAGKEAPVAKKTSEEEDMVKNEKAGKKSAEPANDPDKFDKPDELEEKAISTDGDVKGVRGSGKSSDGTEIRTETAAKMHDIPSKASAVKNNGILSTSAAKYNDIPLKTSAVKSSNNNNDNNNDIPSTWKILTEKTRSWLALPSTLKVIRKYSDKVKNGTTL